MRKTVLALLVLTALAAAAYFLYQKKAEPPPETPTATAPAPAAPAPADSTTPPSLPLPPQQDASEERRLVGVVLQPREADTRAHIFYRGRVDTYAVGAKVYPDDATLIEIQARQATLRKTDDKEVVLYLMPLSDEERFLYTPGYREEDIEDVVGDMQPETPEGKALLEKYPDPSLKCFAIKNDAESDKCFEDTEAEITRRIEVCNEIDDTEVWDRCIDAAEALTPFEP